jgi:exoribonuclease R
LREVLQFGRSEDSTQKTKKSSQKRGGHLNFDNLVDWGERSAAQEADIVPLPDTRIDELDANLESIARQSSERERAADQAERELLNWKKAEFMSHHVGETFDGVITGVKEYGVYVELKDLFIEGLVHISTLNDDYYVFKEKTYSLIGQRGRSYRLGDEVTVLVDRVDQERHLVDFSIIDLRPIKRVGKRNRKQK